MARFRDRRCGKTEQRIAEELTGNWRPEHLFNLRQSLTMYDQLCAVIDEYDAEIMGYIEMLQPEASATARAVADVGEQGEEHACTW